MFLAGAPTASWCGWRHLRRLVPSRHQHGTDHKEEHAESKDWQYVRQRATPACSWRKVLGASQSLTHPEKQPGHDHSGQAGVEAD